MPHLMCPNCFAIDNIDAVIDERTHYEIEGVTEAGEILVDFENPLGQGDGPVKYWCERCGEDVSPEEVSVEEYVDRRLIRGKRALEDVCRILNKQEGEPFESAGANATDALNQIELVQVAMDHDED